MINIVDATIELLEVKDTVTIQEIIEKLDNEKLNNVSKHKLEAYIHMDLMKDGRFILDDEKWGLATNYTKHQIDIMRYRQLGNQITDMDDDIEEEEVELIIELDENAGDEEVNFDFDIDNIDVSEIGFVDED